MLTETKSSQELQALLDAAVDAVIVIDQQGSIQSFNRSAERLFGYEAESVIGFNVSILMDGEDRAAHDTYLQRYVATRVPHIIGSGREVNARRKDGGIFPALLSVGAVAGAEPPRFVGILHDNTDHRRTEEESHRLQERLMHVSRLATVGEMASGIAHELNQPLAAIATYAHACDRLLGLPDPEIEEIQTALKQIAEQAVRAGDIIRKLRNLARMEDSALAPCDLNSVIGELTDLIQADAKAHGVQYRQELAANPATINIDRSQIQQVVLNLVRNALEALAPAQLDVRELLLRTRATPEGDVEICVCDNGPGVDNALKHRIFDPFCSTKPTGTGLGLSISRTIVHAHRGTLEYQPNLPAGACFVVKLPSTQTDSR
jgi:two-component system sensor kinase FixL